VLPIVIDVIKKPHPGHIGAFFKGEIMNVFLKEHRWKFTHKCHECAMLGTVNCPATSVVRP
jgi:hypothetical protein